MSKVLVDPLNLQRFVIEREIDLVRALRRKGETIPKIARIVGRSLRTVSHYLVSNERMSRKILQWNKK